MSDSADDLGTDLSKKERLINAWIAVGPEGKTTDVSDLTGSSRGYASDIRRSMAGEDEEELPFEDIANAYDPELVDRYRSDIADDDIDGRWPFTEQLTEGEPAADTEPPGPATGEPVSRSRAGPSNTGPQPSGSGGTTPRQPPTQPPRQSQQPPRQSPPPRQPPRNARGHGEPGPQTSTVPTGGQPQSSSDPSPSAPQPAQRPQAGRQQPHSAPAQQTAPSGFQDQLADLDRQLIAQQQQATAELNSLPRGSQAHAIAVSKYNLVVDLRESLRQLAGIAPGP